jgi:phage terminase large subunit
METDTDTTSQRKFRILNTHIETPGDGIIDFHGMQNHTAESIKSLEGYDGAWVEEAQTLSQFSLDLLIPTIRKERSELWFSWNPRKRSDPVDAMLRGEHRPQDAVVVKANYRDNPWLPHVLEADIAYQRTFYPEKYAHIWLGDYQRLSEATVFTNWVVAEAPVSPPPNAVLYFGGDWGFAVDPTVLTCGFFGPPETRTFYVYRERYKVGLEIDHTPAFFDGMFCQPICLGEKCLHPQHGWARRWPIVADSARPETISYMQRHGYHKIQAARKGAGSVEEGVTFLQNYRIVVDPSCQHTSDELASYSYKTDKLTGNVIPQLEDKKNHVIDALRYAVETLRLVKPAVATVGAKTAREQDWQRSYFRTR